MINNDMRLYDYWIIDKKDAYGQQAVSEEVQGQVKIAINITSQNIQDNINYKGATYIGLTHAAIDDSYIIRYGEEKLKVMYVNPKGRYKQVFMALYG